ncbi:MULTISPECIES: hypothetical protein [Chryseobacterium]|uniref:TraB family protein n=1 Tax=Chryseobacterium wanjuense TaxID=356305 RepID=A0A1I0RZ94_9FLAO|nr:MULTISPECIES: hypothetical protein [Chryseobacterium]KYH03714.1 hypothetical protein A1704_20185 [Chryseobacterium cucumeris]SEW46995.1 hypothetical protein SAMN05421841_3404 [Chryseobacterium wanjuense]
MYEIIYISTTHKQNGQCNADELCKIVEQIHPEVIFLEALRETYSNNQEHLFSDFGILHNKLEIEAIQKYQYKSTFKYVPVLDSGMSDVFNEKYEIATQNIELQRKIENFNVLSAKYGFQFLNSDVSIQLQEDMRKLENIILSDTALNKDAINSIDLYEDEMLDNIYSYCKTNQFDKAVFMCGVAHRKSIINKVEKLNKNKDITLDWNVLRF